MEYYEIGRAHGDAESTFALATMYYNGIPDQNSSLVADPSHAMNLMEGLLEHNRANAWPVRLMLYFWRLDQFYQQMVASIHQWWGY